MKLFLSCVGFVPLAGAVLALSCGSAPPPEATLMTNPSTVGGAQEAAVAPADMSSSGSPQRATERPGPEIERVPACPMAVLGTQVSINDTDDGIALVFTTVGSTDELRRSVHAMADRHNRVAMAATRGVSDVVPSMARVENVSSGARFIVRPMEAGRRDELRDQFRGYSAQLRAGRCPRSLSGAET